MNLAADGQGSAPVEHLGGVEHWISLPRSSVEMLPLPHCSFLLALYNHTYIVTPSTGIQVSIL